MLPSHENGATVLHIYVPTPVWRVCVLLTLYTTNAALVRVLSYIKSAVGLAHCIYLCVRGQITRRLFDLRALNIDYLRYNVATHDWSKLLLCTDIQVVYDMFLGEVHKL